MNKRTVLSNLVWRFAERCGAQLVTFIVSVVLAHILVPKDYGQIALITVFTTIMQVFVDSGCQRPLYLFSIGTCVYRINYAIMNVEKIRLRRNTAHIDTYNGWIRAEVYATASGIY